MAKAINTKIGSSLLKFTFTDEDGDVFAHFKMNPTDVRLINRCEELANFAEKLAKEMPDAPTAEEIVQYNAKLEEKFNDFLGYDASSTLFGMMSATTVLDDGTIFAAKVLERILEAVKPELEKRHKKMQSALNKHLGKYQK